MSEYDDIINLPHWEPTTRRRMATEQRASQFAPFAALTGHDDAINDTARLSEMHQRMIDDLTVKDDPTAADGDWERSV